MTKDELLLENERLRWRNRILSEALKNNAPKTAIELGFDIQESKIKTPKKRAKEKRNFEICFDCNTANHDGAGWHTADGGVYFVVGKMYDLSPTAIQKIYEKAENTQHWRYTKTVE